MLIWIAFESISRTCGNGHSHLGSSTVCQLVAGGVSAYLHKQIHMARFPSFGLKCLGPKGVTDFMLLYVSAACNSSLSLMVPARAPFRPLGGTVCTGSMWREFQDLGEPLDSRSSRCETRLRRASSSFLADGGRHPLAIAGLSSVAGVLTRDLCPLVGFLALSLVFFSRCLH